ncbi:uncharacterized protein DDB_G0284459-like isoform X2 [Penaeus chinensis]|uniref:uncharacterized protein DDB_G0284459-like isoform X2 n=1 Tax=Penaeus chinensis TaxID=139456 RepID=UPI001FB6A308|nr:uncharacterized protein DDB_G0284459-like isoform X2 [Penaeus chinensis]
MPKYYFQIHLLFENITKTMASDSDLEAYLNQLSKKTHTLKQDVKSQGYSFSRPTSATDKSHDTIDISEESESEMRKNKYPNTNVGTGGPGKISDITALSEKYAGTSFKKSRAQDKFSNLEQKYLGKSTRKLETRSSSDDEEKSDKNVHSARDTNLHKKHSNQTDFPKTSGKERSKPRLLDSESSIDEDLARYLNDSLSTGNLRKVNNNSETGKSELSSDDSEDRGSNIFNFHNIMTVADIMGHVTDEGESKVQEEEIRESQHSISSEVSELCTEENTSPHKKKETENYNRKNARVENVLVSTTGSIFHSSRRNSTSSIAEVILSRKNSKIDLDSKGEYLGVYREESLEESVPESVPNSASGSEVAEALEESSVSNDLKTQLSSSSSENEDSQQFKKSITEEHMEDSPKNISASNRKGSEDKIYKDDTVSSNVEGKQFKTQKKNENHSRQSEATDSLVNEKKKPNKTGAKSKLSKHHGHRGKKKKKKYISSSSSTSSSSSSETSSEEDKPYRHRSSRRHRHKQKHYFNPWEMPPYMNPWMAIRPPQQAYFTTGPIETSFIPRVSEGTFSMRSMVGADELLKQQVALTRQFLDSQKSLYHAYTATLTSSHHYTSLLETEKYIAARRKPPLTFDEAYKMVKEEMKASKR